FRASDHGINITLRQSDFSFETAVTTCNRRYNLTICRSIQISSEYTAVHLAVAAQQRYDFVLQVVGDSFKRLNFFTVLHQGHQTKMQQWRSAPQPLSTRRRPPENISCGIALSRFDSLLYCRHRGRKWPSRFFLIGLSFPIRIVKFVLSDFDSVSRKTWRPQTSYLPV
ncbi:hypothetical protein MUK42_33269, partial [Musa troglodytarum]